MTRMSHWLALGRCPRVGSVCSCLPAPARVHRDVGLIRSLSASRRDPSESCHAVSCVPGRPPTGGAPPERRAALGMLAQRVDHVIGVDTHRDSHTAAVLDTTGGVVADLTVPADAFGYKRVLAFGRTHAPARRAWAIEGTGSFGAGLTTFLLERGEGAWERSALRSSCAVGPTPGAFAQRPRSPLWQGRPPSPRPRGRPSGTG